MKLRKENCQIITTEKDYYKIKKFDIKIEYIKIFLNIENKDILINKIKNYMIKITNYLLQSIFIYFSFLLSRIIGLRLSRKIFSNFFSYIGPIFKSKKILDKNLNNFANNVSNANKVQIINNMWKNYGMTFIEYIF